jgi:hypothetical protein
MNCSAAAHSIASYRALLQLAPLQGCQSPLLLLVCTQVLAYPIILIDQPKETSPATLKPCLRTDKGHLLRIPALRTQHTFYGFHSLPDIIIMRCCTTTVRCAHPSSLTGV